MLAEMLQSGLQIIQPHLDRKQALYLRQPQQITQLLASVLKEELMHLNFMLVKVRQVVVSTMPLSECVYLLQGAWALVILHQPLT